MRVKLSALTVIVLFSTTVYAGGGLFGLGRRAQVNTVYCGQQQTYYQQQYYQPTYQYQQYQAVAAIPLATVPVAVDLQAYMYSVNSNAFQSFRDYMNTKANNDQYQVQQVPQQQTQQQVAQVHDDNRLAGVQVLGKSCKSCHSGVSPKANFSIFDSKGNVYTSLPWNKIIERISSQDPETRMPPKGALPVSDVLSIVRLAVQPEVGGVARPEEKIASRNPFE